MNDDKLTDGINKGSEDENNHSVGTVDSPYHKSNEGANKAEEKSSTSNQHIGKNNVPEYLDVAIPGKAKSFGIQRVAREHNTIVVEIKKVESDNETFVIRRSINFEDWSANIRELRKNFSDVLRFKIGDAKRLNRIIDNVEKILNKNLDNFNLSKPKCVEPSIEYTNNTSNLLSELKDGTINQKDRGIQERRVVLKRIVSQYGLDIIAVNTAKKNEAKTDKSIQLFKEIKTDILAKNLTTEQYIKKIDAGIYDNGYAGCCGLIKRDIYTGYKFGFLDIDKRLGVIAFLDRGDRKMAIEELADRQYVEFNGIDMDERIHIPFLLEPDATIAAKGSDAKLGIEININGVMFGAGSPHHNGGFYQQFGKADITKIWILNKTQAFILQDHIASICQEHGVNYFSGDKNNQQEKEKFYQAYAAHLHNDSTRVKKGERHDVMKFICCSYFSKQTGEWSNLTDDQRFERVQEYDKKYCEPPLYETDPQEVRDLWNWARKTFGPSRDERKEASTLLSTIESFIIRNYPTASLEEIKEWCIDWNKKHSSPPLDEKEFEKQWQSALNWEPVRKKITAVADANMVLGTREEVPPSPEPEPSPEALEAELASKIPGKDYAEFVIETTKLTVKQEDALVRQIYYTAISKDTREPLNLAILAPTSEGKTYPTLQTIQYFPPEDIRKIGSMSPRVVIRENGILVDNDTNQPITGKIKELRRKIEEEKFRRQIEKRTKTKEALDELRRKKDDDNNTPVTVEIGKNDNLENMQEELARFCDNSKNLIDLRGKLLVFLEPPNQDTWNILKPILSHDSEEIEHPYVHDSDMGFKVKKVVTIGWPACIFCSARNEISKWPIWPEIQSRFLVVSPNMVQQKYSDGNMLIARRMGLPGRLQEDLIISNSRIDLAKKCVSYTLQQNRLCCRSGDDSRNHTNPVWIQYTNILGQVLPAQKGTDNRITKRIFSLLVNITLAKAHLRDRLQFGDESLAIADIDNDLLEVLQITQNLSGIPPFKLKVFREVFLPLYESKHEKDKSDDGKEERMIGLTTRELCDSYKKKMGKTITTDSMKKTYLSEFLDNELIDEVQSQLDKRQHIYYPIVDIPSTSTPPQSQQITATATDGQINKLSNMDAFDNLLQDPKIIVSKNCKPIPEKWLELEISNLLKCRMPEGVPGRFELYNKDGEHVCICKFIKGYSTHSMIRYFSRPIFYSFSSKVFGDIIRLPTTTDERCSTQSQSQPSSRNDGKIYRSNPGSDIWLCEMCNIRGDRFFLEEHRCSRNLKKNRK